MQARSRVFATLIAGLALTLGAPCQAQEEGAPSENVEPSSEARAVFDRAMELYDQRAYARTEQEFRRAWELMQDHPRRSLVLVNIARCVEAQPGREREALGIYRQVLEEIGASGSDDPMIHEGQQRARDRIAELDARLAALGTTEPAPTTEGAISPVGPVVIGAAGLLLVSGIVTGALTLGETDRLSLMCPGDVCPESARGQFSTVEGLSITTDVLMSMAAATAIAGLVLTIVLRDAAAPVEAAAACTQEGCMATFGGRL